jgi:thiol-disulfide isomerase/thioredoxin
LEIKKSILVISIGTLITLIVFFASNVYNTIQRFDEISKQSKHSYVLKPNKVILFDYENSRTDTILMGNKKVFIHFWATWCQPCIKEFKLFNSILKQQREFEIYFVTDEDSLTVSKFLNKNNFKNIPFYSLKEKDSTFNHKALPTSYFSINDSLLKRVTGKYNWKSFFDKTHN